MTDTLPDDLRDAIEQGLSTYDISVDGDLEVTDQEDGYEVEVPFTGELLIDETFANQGSLLYNKEAEVVLKGVRDGKLLVTVRAN